MLELFVWKIYEHDMPKTTTKNDMVMIIDVNLFIKTPN